MEDIGQYIELVKKELNQYMLIIFDNDFNKNIFNRFLDDYINVRYFNSKQNIKDKKNLYTSVLDSLENTCKDLVRIYEKTEVVNIKEVFAYIVLWDNIGKNEKNENIINKIAEFRKEKLNIKTSASFSNKLLKEVIKRKELKAQYINGFFLEEIKLKNKKISEKNIDLIELKYNMVFPSSISPKIIKQVFNTGITAEDKLIIEYHMVNANILKDIIKGDFSKEYIVEFITTLLEKKTKLIKLLKIIADEFQKERISLLIEHKNFTEENKNLIYGLMRQGFRIAIKLDDTFKEEEKNIKKLNVFSYVVMNKEDNYSETEKYTEITEKIIKI